MNKQKRRHKKTIRRGFKKRCTQLSERVRSIGLDLHWSRNKHEPRSTTKFSLWPRGDSENPIIINLAVEQMEEYIDHYYKLKAFL